MKTRLKILFRRIRVWPRCLARIVRIKYELFILERNLRELLLQQKAIHQRMMYLALEGVLVDIHADRGEITIDPKTRTAFEWEIDFQTMSDVVVCDQIKRIRRTIARRLFELGKLDEVTHMFAH